MVEAAERGGRPPAYLALADGAVFAGRAAGAAGETSGEVVFHTGATGYQEVITDPSYCGQIVVMTTPHIGNYGVNDEDAESRRPFLSGFAVKEMSRRTSNWRAEHGLEEWLRSCGVVSISGIDTRAVTRHVRHHGAMPGAIAATEERAVELAAAAPPMDGRDLVGEVTVDDIYRVAPTGRARFDVGAFDFGIKRQILRNLSARGCRVTVYPASTPGETLLAAGHDGVFLSNGPGDPAAMPGPVNAVRTLLGEVPVFGICLGHQILGRALGADTFKLPFGHHGANHPVRRLADGQVEITSQNHGFSVDADGLGRAVERTHVNLNDGTVEGLRCVDVPAFSVQYHPEAGPGPHDARYLFDQFLDLMREHL
jgi:carbamoyl-phosphate synthase small subunit